MGNECTVCGSETQEQRKTCSDECLSEALARGQRGRIKTMTPARARVLRYIRTYSRRGYPPSLRDIGEHFGWSSTNGINDHLKALERDGFIRRTPRISRGIVLTDKGKRCDA